MIFFLPIAIVLCIMWWQERQSRIAIEELSQDVRNNLLSEKSLLVDQIEAYKQKIHDMEAQAEELRNEADNLRQRLIRHEQNLENLLRSNLSSIPWLAGMISDFLTYDLEVTAKKLDWGKNAQRAKKVESIRTIRAAATKQIEAAKEAVYQLAYLKKLYPSLEDVLEMDFRELPLTSEVPEYDPVKSYLSAEEWESLSKDERDQMALDRYIESRKKSNWQIGRDYELSVAYEYMKAGYQVDTPGSYLKMEDMGRDLIAKRRHAVHIIQCKYWSEKKVIHEKHIFQLYGTCVSYRINHPDDFSKITPVFVTNTALSDMAKKVAAELGVYVSEHHKMRDFPRIKCNINRDEYGMETRIYHLPMDALYDVTQIKNAGEFYAFTVKEAVAHGFRRAYKWSGK